MFGFGKRRAKEDAEKAEKALVRISTDVRSVLHHALDEAKIIKYRHQAPEDIELEQRIFDSVKRAMKQGVDAVLLENLDPFGVEIKALGTAAQAGGMSANGPRNEAIMFGTFSADDAASGIRGALYFQFEKLMSDLDEN